MITSSTSAPLRVIPIGAIDEPQLPSRSKMDDDNLDKLCASIRATGFWSAIVVVERGERYEVVAGHRRTIAARRVGLPALPCFVFASESAALEAIQSLENARKEDLSVTDEAIWFSQLLDKYPDEGTDGLAARVQETRNYVEGRLALLQGCEHVFAALAAKEISIGVAQQLNRCTDDAHRFMLLDTAVRGGATVGLVSQWVNEWKTLHQLASGHIQPGAPIASGPAPIVNDYFRCRVCAENDNTANMQPVQIHDYCLQPLIDRSTGFFRSRADSVEFPRTREDAVRLVKRVLERFPELADDPAARD